MIRRLLMLFLLVLPLAATAQSPPDQALAGSWALRIDGATVFRFDLARGADGWRGSWWRPKSFNTDGYRFSDLADESLEIEASAGQALGEWAELSFPDKRPGAVPDVFRFRATGPGKAEMIYVGTGLSPFVLERATAETILGPWQRGKIYRRPGAPPVQGAAAPALPPGPPQGPPAVRGR